MMTSKKQFNIPILLLTWKREKEIEFIINKLREINAVNIYINSDGYDLNLPKTSISEKIIRTRNLILKNQLGL